MINESTVELCKKEKELIDKQVLTVEETCYLVDSFQEIANEITKENSLLRISR